MNTTQKKLTARQMERRLEKAIIHVDRTKDTKEIYFDDKGLRLVVSEDYAVVATGYHRHVFNNFTASGVSRPYLYVQSFVDIALSHKDDIVAERADGSKGYSYGKLMAVLKEKGDENDKEYIICHYVDMWLFTIFQNLYTIGENVGEAFLVYLSYVCGLSRNMITLAEHKDGLTNKGFVAEFIEKVKELTEGIDERTIFEARTDEQMIEDNISAINDTEMEEMLNESKG